ncbi:Acg family FMN-binding oxidoreductase [Polymorphum gilvum]|uniref:Nitroreductase domain-containing protein n=1 Tax=Polymorphum gilvum (strain LMG 25793 / CGMCC 1.9160 / SL003B-26A1) TaxID=991905 RepID=F2J0A1_POLGS|nr:nitroreductase family protein [Polymorphum gilvum]ADZ68636.1 hypothetical protein SL003B_0197 [Polymorphum gilvum SL003B-26A1]
MPTRRFVVGSAATAVAGAGLAWWLWPGDDPAFDSSVAESRKRLSDAPLPFTAAVADIVRYATLAANSHNTQPWIFEVGDRFVRIRPDETRRCPVVDPDDRHLMASLGCAAENLDLAARALGFRSDIVFDAPTRSVVVRFEDAKPEATAAFHAIPERQSTRAPFDPAALPDEDLHPLLDACARPGVFVRSLTDRSDLDRLKDFVLAGNTAQCADPAFVEELGAWVRFNRTQAAKTRDGLYSGATGNPPLPRWLGRRLFPLVFTASAENPKYASQLDGSAGAVVLSAERDDPEGWFNVGRASQRFQLEATARGIRSSFVNQPVEVAAVRADFQSWLGDGLRPALVLRYGRGPALPPSLRRPVADVVRFVPA